MLVTLEDVKTSSLAFIGNLHIIEDVLSLLGHPMDLFLKISVLQAHFCWLGDVEEVIVLGRKVLLGKR